MITIIVFSAKLKTKQSQQQAIMEQRSVCWWTPDMLNGACSFSLLPMEHHSYSPFCLKRKKKTKQIKSEVALLVRDDLQNHLILLYDSKNLSRYRIVWQHLFMSGPAASENGNTPSLVAKRKSARPWHK